MHRDDRFHSAGHVKVRDSLRHASHPTRFEHRIELTPQSIRNPGDPWDGDGNGDGDGMPTRGVDAWRPEDAAALFVAGLDWNALPDPAPVPVVNLVREIRHAEADSPLRAQFARPATRIFVGAQVAAANLATGVVRGPVHVIPFRIDLSELPATPRRRDRGVVIAGSKNRTSALALRERLAESGIAADCLGGAMPRSEFLARLARTEVVVTLPYAREGVFLPAIEAMALGAIVVGPDCVGNHGSCRDRETARRPAHVHDDVVAATLAAVGMDAASAAAEAAEVHRHALESERAAFLRTLDDL